MTVVTNPAVTDSDQNIEAVPDAYRYSHGAEDNYNGYREGSAYNLRGLDDNTRSDDVVFVAGSNGDTWRYPGNRALLSSVSPVFAALLNTKSDLIIVDFVDRRGFEQLMRYRHCEPLLLDSVATARSTLDTAHKFLYPDLMEKCVKRLDELLDASVALELMEDLRYLCNSLPGAPSAPPLPAFNSDAAARLLARCAIWCDSLAHNALLVIDENADAALTNHRFEELAYEDLALIVRRDTLRVSSEMILIEALSRWATTHCRRTKRELTSSNKRAALGGLIYCPRYLLLEGDELTRALEIELLEPMEKTLVVARARNLPTPMPVGAEQEGLLRRWARPRPTQPAALPVHLSARSKPPPVDEPQPSMLCARKPKRPKKSSSEGSGHRNKRGCCASFGECLLRAFICLFD